MIWAFWARTDHILLLILGIRFIESVKIDVFQEKMSDYG